ncbi:Mycobacterium numidiamassiliense ORFan [Mycobacterium numidiamassiliense]|uniref:Mycobacterium numidiamassiliense ORFan n=1 Tax=Mycobacterium numidiamassiliense TaxID=1841861 RepID=A0A2U3P9Z1_9MYCO|nr:DUF732 domain-containing protein [Mycobacterium numidiamassiliense]SPM40550.1 Mycobacterium numidiamassiliense ORFan [Mycobacterium numidiamassiliense]
MDETMRGPACEAETVRIAQAESNWPAISRVMGAALACGVGGVAAALLIRQPGHVATIQAPPIATYVVTASATATVTRAPALPRPQAKTPDDLFVALLPEDNWDTASWNGYDRATAIATGKEQSEYLARPGATLDSATRAFRVKYPDTTTDDTARSWIRDAAQAFCPQEMP